MSAAEDAFEALFFSEAGSILGLLLIIVLVTGISVKRPIIGMALFPILVWFSFLYFSRMDVAGTFVWHFIIMMFVTIFNVLYVTGRIYQEVRR